MAQIWSGESKSITNIATGGKISTAKYTINDDYIYVETGVLSSKGEQYPMWAVRDVDFMQSLVQKARKVSTIRIRFEHNDFTGKAELLLEDIEASRDLVAQIITTSTAARLDFQRLAQTQHINYQGVHPTSSQSPAPAEDDVYAKLEKLGALLEKGILTKEEFDAQKAKLLGL
jgi:uncharacterized membrane protein YdbT with pleckstrin-like domain